MTGVQRVSMRYDDDGQQRDLVGELIDADGGSVTILPWDRGPVTVAVASIRARRDVPERVVRPSSSTADLERMAALGWPGLEQQRVGGWVLKAGLGYTSRANSLLPVGEPGMPDAEALGLVHGFYAARGLPAKVQISGEHRLDRPLQDAGWTTDKPTIFMVRDLRDLPDAADTARWDDEPDQRWLDSEPSTDKRRVPVLTAARARYGQLGDGPAADAVARVATHLGWAGISCVHVPSARRGRGLGRSIMEQAMREGRRQGARYCYLQVLEDNHVAIALYEALGFTEHHRYHYLTAPQTPVE